MGQISATIQPDNTVRKLMGKNSETYDNFHINSVWFTVWFMYRFV